MSSAHSSYTSLFSNQTNHTQKSDQSKQKHPGILDQLAFRMSGEELKQLQSVINKDQNMRRREAHRVLQLKRQVVTQQRTNIQSVQRVPKRERNFNLAEQMMNNAKTKGFQLVDKVNFRLGTEDLRNQVIRSEVCKRCQRTFDRACKSLKSEDKTQNSKDDDSISICSTTSSSCLEDHCPDCKFPICENCRVEIDNDTKDKHLPAALCAVLGLTVSKDKNEDQNFVNMSRKLKNQPPYSSSKYKNMDNGFDSRNYEPKMALTKASPQTLEGYRDTLGPYRQTLKQFKEVPYSNNNTQNVETMSQHSFLSDFSDFPSISTSSKFTSGNSPPWLCEPCFQKRHIKAKTGQWFSQSSRHDVLMLSKGGLMGQKKHLVMCQKSCDNIHDHDTDSSVGLDSYGATLPRLAKKPLKRQNSGPSTKNRSIKPTPTANNSSNLTPTQQISRNVPKTLILSCSSRRSSTQAEVSGNSANTNSFQPNTPTTLQIHNKFALKAMSLSNASLNKLPYEGSICQTPRGSTINLSLHGSTQNLSYVNSPTGSIANLSCSATPRISRNCSPTPRSRTPTPRKIALGGLDIPKITGTFRIEKLETDRFKSEIHSAEILKSVQLPPGNEEIIINLSSELQNIEVAEINDGQSTENINPKTEIPKNLTIPENLLYEVNDYKSPIETNRSSKSEKSQTNLSQKSTRTSTQSVSIFEVPDQTLDRNLLNSISKYSKLTLTKSQSFPKTTHSQKHSIAASSSSHLDTLQTNQNQQNPQSPKNPQTPQNPANLNQEPHTPTYLEKYINSEQDFSSKDHLRAPGAPLPHAADSSRSSMITNCDSKIDFVISSSTNSRQLRAPTAVPEATPDSVRHQNPEITESILSITNSVSIEAQNQEFRHNQFLLNSEFSQQGYAYKAHNEEQYRPYCGMNSQSSTSYETSNQQNSATSFLSSTENSNVPLTIYHDKSIPKNTTQNTPQNTPKEREQHVTNLSLTPTTPKKTPKSPFRKVTNKVKKSLQSFRRKK